MSLLQVRKLIAVLSLSVILLALVLSTGSDRISKPMLLNGDSVGMERAESLEQYEARVAPTLQRDGEGFALVTFDHPLTGDEAGALLNSMSIQRVSALTFVTRANIEMPEPISPETRADVVNRSLQINEATDQEISGVVVFDSMQHIRALRAESGVIAVEALPEGAAWGRFGIRPVVVKQ